MRALVTTNHLNLFSGSEIVCLEVAEALSSMGYDVTLACNYLGDNFKIIPVNGSITVKKIQEGINVFQYDVVWALHNTLSQLEFENESGNAREIPKLIYASLSPYEPFEVTGLASALILGARIVGNSKETCEKLMSFGLLPRQVQNLRNAAPQRFYQGARTSKSELERILFVSNHFPNEVVHAMHGLRAAGIDVRVLGRGYEHRRLEPSDLKDCDAVVTIGKTVQYCIMAGVPVYCYDRFGGPGWLSQENFQLAEDHNFSGRCQPRRVSSSFIETEILEGYSSAAAFFTKIQEAGLHRYSLEKFLTNILEEKCEGYDLNSLRHALLLSEKGSGQVISSLYNGLAKSKDSASRKSLRALLRRLFARVAYRGKS